MLAVPAWSLLIIEVSKMKTNGRPNAHRKGHGNRVLGQPVEPALPLDAASRTYPYGGRRLGEGGHASPPRKDPERRSRNTMNPIATRNMTTDMALA